MAKAEIVTENPNLSVVPADWQAKMKEYGWQLHDVEEFGGGIPRISKDSLLGVPFVILELKELDSDRNGGTYFFCHIVTMDGREGFFSDGGVGIRETLTAFVQQTEQRGGLVCKNGLTRSDYEADSESGRPAGTTYYIA
jgi:hypothetical protein